jgi:hypothetical protein
MEWYNFRITRNASDGYILLYSGEQRLYCSTEQGSLFQLQRNGGCGQTLVVGTSEHRKFDGKLTDPKLEGA